MLKELLMKFDNANEVLMDISNEMFYVRESFFNLWHYNVTSYPNGSRHLIITDELLDDNEYSFNIECIESGHYDDNGAWVFEANGVTVSFLCV